MEERERKKEVVRNRFKASFERKSDADGDDDEDKE